MYEKNTGNITYSDQEDETWMDCDSVRIRITKRTPPSKPNLRYKKTECSKRTVAHVIVRD